MAIYKDPVKELLASAAGCRASKSVEERRAIRHPSEEGEEGGGG